MLNGTAYNGEHLTEQERLLGNVVEVPITQLGLQIFLATRGLSRITPFGKFTPPILIRVGNKLFTKRNARFLYRNRYKAGFGALGLYAASKIRYNQIRQTRGFMEQPRSRCWYCRRFGYPCAGCRKRKQKFRYRM